MRFVRLLRRALICGLSLSALLAAVVWLAPGDDHFDRILDFDRDDDSLYVTLQWDRFSGGLSYFGGLRLLFENPHVRVALSSRQGQIDSFDWAYLRPTSRVERARHWCGPGGFHFERFDGPGRYPLERQTNAGVPCWLFVSILSFYPAWTLLRGPLRRGYRVRRRLCVCCGYSLTGLPDPRCSECGERIHEVRFFRQRFRFCILRIRSIIRLATIGVFAFGAALAGFLWLDLQVWEPLHALVPGDSHDHNEFPPWVGVQLNLGFGPVDRWSLVSLSYARRADAFELSREEQIPSGGGRMSEWAGAGFVVRRCDVNNDSPSKRLTTLEVPCWFAVVGLSAYPVAVMGRTSRRGRPNRKEQDGLQT
jgi:hypothetical protein